MFTLRANNMAFKNYPPEINTPSEICDTGVKFDGGKLSVHELFSQFPQALLAVTDVLDYGTRKYSLGGWKEVENAEYRYRNALGRHLLYEQAEGKFDEESCRLHMAHVAWNALAILELMGKQE